MKDKIEAAKRAYNGACERMDAAVTALEELPEDADAEAIAPLQAEFEAAEQETSGRKAEVGRLAKIAEARELHKPLALSSDDDKPATSITVGKEEPAYRQDTPASFFRDLVFAKNDQRAQERLRKNDEQMRAEVRVVTSADPGAAGFIPPIYLSEAWAELPRAGRPFADIVPKMALPDVGLTISIPKVQSGVTEAVQTAENVGVSSTDIDSQTISVSVRTIAGQNDISRQSLERSFPGMDMVIYRDLLRAHNSQLDTQLLSGTGASGQHLGIRAVSGVNTVAYTDATPTAAELAPKLYDAIQKIAATRFEQPTHIVMHPRRAAWLASNLSSTFPLFQLGGYFQAAGAQSGGFTTNIAGLEVVQDPNIGTTYGAATNEDEIYVVFADDLFLMEGAVRQAAYEDVLSANLVVRLQLFSYSAFASARQPAAITVISGSGLVQPVF